MSGLKGIDASLVVKAEPNPDLDEIHPGDTVKVHYRVIEGTRERIQVFQGTVIKIRNGGIDANFTVRRVTHAVGVERTFLFNSPGCRSWKGEAGQGSCGPDSTTCEIAPAKLHGSKKSASPSPEAPRPTLTRS